VAILLSHVEPVYGYAQAHTLLRIHEPPFLQLGLHVTFVEQSVPPKPDGHEHLFARI
jgi:hypothetical protein